VTAPETIRFDAFQTTSPTGTFVSCTTPTNPPTDYMSKNSSNKNICYKDSTEGVYTITAKTNNTVNSLIATQAITITSSTPPSSGGGSSTSTATSTGSTATSTATSTSSTSNGSGSSYYVYSGSVSLSTYEPLNLSVEAGRERLAYLHTPIEFKSYAKDRATGKSVSGARFYWTFGDGASAEGSVVNHSYLFPGEYNVVLNSSSGEDDAVDITKVKVVIPQAKINYADSYVEFVNENSLDLNIGEWKIRGNDKEYIIPKDTIISALGSLKIPASILGAVFGSEKLSVVYPDNQLAFETSRISSVEKQKQITEISQRLALLQDELYLAYANENNVSPYMNGESSRLIGEGGVKKVEGETLAGGDTNNSVASPISSPVSQSVLSKIVDFFATMFR
jgi:hypothetical protein